MSHHTQLMARGGRPREDSIWSNCSADSWLRCPASDTTTKNNSTISNNSTQHNANASAPSPSTNFDLKLFIKDVHDKHGRKRPLSVKPWASVKDVKDLLASHLHVPPSSQRLYFGPLLTSARELPNHRTLMDAGIYRNGETLLLEITTRGNNAMLLGGTASLSGGAGQDSHSISSLRSKANDVCVSSSLLDLTPKSLQRLVQQARRGLALGFKPALAPDGSGGSYFLCDARKKRVGVFKPADEEPFSENNPRGYVPHDSNEGGGGGGAADSPTESLRQGIRPGELCLREVAAFILDHDGFSDVPMTTLAEAQHPALHVNGKNWTLSEGGASVGVHSISSPLSSTNLMTAASAAAVGSGSSSSRGDLIKKFGSFQEYVHAECTMDDLSPSKISVEEVHKIAILDIRIMNADRNVANIMCQRIPEDPDHFRLIPIDHGYSLRSVCDVAWFDWCWLDWPQTKQPLGKKARDYVLNLDIDEDVRLLKERLGMGDDVLDYYRVSCMILKSGVKAGLTLYEIASGILCRTDPSGETPSKLETLTSVAGELATSAVHNGRFHHATASLALEEKLSTTKKTVDRRSSAFPSSYSKPRPVVRSASSSVFSQVPSLGGESAFTDELFRGSSNLSGGDFSSSEFHSRASSMNTNPPEVVQSSQSDDNSFDSASCSFASGPDDAEADEWAADMIAIADQNMEIKENGLFGRNRSTSESSSSSSEGSSSSDSSKSPVGFWTVRPGSSFDERSEDDDDDSICWAPSLSHNPITSTKDTNLFSPHAFSSSNLVKFVEETKTGSTDEDSNNADDEFGPITPPTQVTSFSAFKPLQKTMYRSHSYAAFSSYSSHDYDRRPTMFQNTLSQSTNIRSRSGLSSTQEKDLFRTYFMKFVDLLIVREIERLVHNPTRADE
mmetsp:Transcript_25408/g.41272  ORF Transcript_25408/g.41272 Transcript_25408/m.41272 type:complete len:899 (+) Transcript_25408:75-2771(+)